MAKCIKVEKGRWQYALEYACTLIQQGRAVAFPTDTYYGLGVDPFNLAAVNELYELKKRDHHKPVLLAVSSVEQAEELMGELPPLFYRLVDRFWPGPLTLVLPAAKGLPFKITGNTGKVALRYPDCQFAVALAKAVALPLTATSANISEMPACATAEEVEGQLGDRLPLILDAGPAPGGKPSTILELTQERCRVIRHGRVPVEDLDEFLF
jgi:tRNA threonylcarbamoyl adenosine modification protein (Sua5/YciO/YrdC/YwlC family)